MPSYGQAACPGGSVLSPLLARSSRGCLPVVPRCTHPAGPWRGARSGPCSAAVSGLPAPPADAGPWGKGGPYLWKPKQRKGNFLREEKTPQVVKASLLRVGGAGHHGDRSTADHTLARVPGPLPHPPQLRGAPCRGWGFPCALSGCWHSRLESSCQAWPSAHSRCCPAKAPTFCAQAHAVVWSPIHGPVCLPQERPPHTCPLSWKEGGDGVPGSCPASRGLWLPSSSVGDRDSWGPQGGRPSSGQGRLGLSWGKAATKWSPGTLDRSVRPCGSSLRPHTAQVALWEV